MPTDLPDPLASLIAQHAELGALLSEMDDVDWGRPTRCEGWDIADVVLHLAQTDEMAIGSLHGRFTDTLAALVEGASFGAGVDQGAAAMVARDRHYGPVTAFVRWQQGTAALVAAARAIDPRTRVTWVAGELTARTLVTTRLAETWIHSGDVAAALGRTLAPTGRLQLIARLAWRTLPYAFAREGRTLHGPVAFELNGPAGERWAFIPEEAPLTWIRGEALELCEVAARRCAPEVTGLTFDGPDGTAVLEVVRTYA